MWFRTRRPAVQTPTRTRTPLRLTASTQLVTAMSDERAWYVIDVSSGAALDSDSAEPELTLPTGRVVRVVAQERPWTLTWRDEQLDPGVTDSGGTLQLRRWHDASTTITVTHHLGLPEGVSWESVTTRQHLLDDAAEAHAKAWVARLSRYAASALGSD